MRQMPGQTVRSTRHNAVRHDGQLGTPFYGVTSWLVPYSTGNTLWMIWIVNNCNMILSTWLWFTKWCLMFNPVKFRIMTLGHSSSVSDYIMRGSGGNIVNIEKSRLEKDIRIMITSDLKFLENMHMVTKKANGIMAVIRRTFSLILNVSTCCINHWWDHTLNMASLLGFLTKRKISS